MSFDLHLTFRGLCAFTPSEAIPSSAELPHLTPQVRVLLPNVVDGDAVSKRLGVPPLCPHEPQLAVHGSGEPPVPLRGHDVKILNVAGSAPSILNAGQQTPGVLLHTTFWRLADIGKVRPNFQVNADLFEPSPPGDLLAARLQLTAADLFGREVNSFSITFPVDPPYVGIFALAVRAEIRIVGEEGSFEITEFGSAAPPKVVTFRPASPGGIVTATMSNLCDQDADAMLIKDHDFAAFALLQAGPAEPLPLPGPSPLPSGGPGEVRAEASQTGISSCIPVVTPPHPSA